MGEGSRQIRQFQTWINGLQAGDPAALAALLGHAGERLRCLPHRMLRGFACVKRWEDTDDVLQNATIRLLSALREVTPRSARDFFALAALQIRRELIDLARKYNGPQGMGAKHSSNVQAEQLTSRPRAGKADSTL